MKALRLVALLTLLVSAFAIAADKVGLSDLLKDPKKFDGKTIAVTGTVAEFKQKTSRKGNKYFTFSLKAGEKEEINVYSQGEAGEGIKDGARVVATGVFRVEKKIMDFTVKNELDATAIKGKENGVKPVKPAG